MSTQDKLPPLPMQDVSRDNLYGYTADQMRAYARAALAAQEAEPVAHWTIEYGNDTGPNDEGFWQWWDVVNDDRSFRCDSKEDAEWLCGRLNAAPPAREAVALTEEQVDVLARPCYSTYGGFDISAFARAVERAVWQANNLREPT